MECLICRAGRVDARCPHHIEGVHDLGGQLIPQLEWKVAVCCGEGHDESVLECLDHPFHDIDAVVVGFDELQFAIVLSQELFNIFSGFIVHDVELNVETLLGELIKLLVVCLECSLIA
jgi:hypothetical protein